MSVSVCVCVCVCVCTGVSVCFCVFAHIKAVQRDEPDSISLINLVIWDTLLTGLHSDVLIWPHGPGFCVCVCVCVCVCACVCVCVCVHICADLSAFNDYQEALCFILLVRSRQHSDT